MQSTANPAPAPLKFESAEWYRTATFRRTVQVRGTDSVQVCALVPRDSTVALSYVCDVILIALRPAVPTQAIRGLLSDISGAVGSVLQSPYMNVIEIRVSPGTESSAIRRAFADSNVVRVELDWQITGAL